MIIPFLEDQETVQMRPTRLAKSKLTNPITQGTSRISFLLLQSSHNPPINKQVMSSLNLLDAKRFINSIEHEIKR